MLKIPNLRFAVGTFSPVLLRSEVVLPVSWHLQRRTVTSKKFRVEKEKPPPFPYETKDYNLLRCCYDRTYKRFDENTKVIVVDGPISLGKHEIAKQIAEELDMKFFPDPTMDLLYINDYGYDMRNLDPKMPEAGQSYDEARFCREPDHFLSATFQTRKYKFRYAKYFDMLAHLLNTGQGVVTVRSPYSDVAFMEAMRSCNYISEAAKLTYNEVVRHTLLFLLRPHLIIYLGASVDATMRNIKQEKESYMVNSKALTRDFITHMNRHYNDYLRQASIHSKMLIYDWSDGGDVEVIVEDIEAIDFDDDSIRLNPKLCDWRMEEADMDQWRVMYSTDKIGTMCYFDSPLVYLAPEMYMSGNDLEVWTQLWWAAPGMQYQKGFDPTRGDKNILFKTGKDQGWDPIA